MSDSPHVHFGHARILDYTPPCSFSETPSLSKPLVHNRSDRIISLDSQESATIERNRRFRGEPHPPSVHQASEAVGCCSWVLAQLTHFFRSLLSCLGITQESEE